MMSQSKAVFKDESQSSGTRKTASSKQQQADQQQQQQQQLVHKCPRCDSSNTKFCYYNNYSLTQPRHFCKTCRRYWTKGGALRNVPIGGGCRKTKKLKSTSKLMTPTGDSSGSSTSGIGGFKFFHAVSPSVDFQLDGVGGGGGLSFPRPCFSSFDQTAGTGTGSCNYSLMGVNYGPIVDQNIDNNNNNTSIASSIESLSCLNQDLHWKLQQQRLASLFGDDQIQNCNRKDQTQNLLQPILFQNLEIPKESPATATTGDANATEWQLFQNSYGGNDPTMAARNGTGNNGWNHGIQANWDHFSALP